MIISHKEIERCLNNPADWVGHRLAPHGGFRRAGYDGILLDCIYRFHRTSDVEIAREYLEKRLDKAHLQNAHRIDGMLKSLESYVAWYNDTSPSVADTRYRLSYELGYGIALGGLISRIDIISEGYRAILLGRIPNDWQTELRMPLIQRAAAKAFGRKENQFAVGYQELNASNLQTLSFTATQMDEAEGKARELAAGIASEIARHQSEENHQ